MAARSCRRRRCLHCNELFHPDPRNRTRQRYCSQTACRQASKKASQARWLTKPANQDYFRGPANTERNRRWRAAHPGYWRHPQRSRTQQDSSLPQEPENQSLTPVQTAPAQQDPLALQLALFVGLIANLAASTQQETIDRSIRRLHDLGREVLQQSPNNTLLAVMLSGASPNPP